jgi:predicted nucleic acid-binding protein
VLYLDTSASVKLLLAEDESDALADFLGSADEPLVTSRVGIVELRRIGRRGSASSDRADALAASFAVIELDSSVERIAISLDASLRSLDAVHLASAIALGESLRGFVCYDARLAAAAGDLGLHIAAPVA